MEAVQRLGGCPRIVRGDQGTENVKVRDLQRFLCRNIHDSSGIDSYIEGASTANQQIELVGLPQKGINGILHLSV